jgi:hypothetical protein
MPGRSLTAKSAAGATTEKTHFVCLVSSALGGSHKLFNFAGNKVFSVFHRFIQCLGSLASRKTAPMLNHALQH